MEKEAALYHSLANDVVICDLCRRRCTIPPGKSGACRTRRNDDGKLVSLVYGRAIALNPDPIEKKPLFHFLPGTLSMSTATVGCNFTCDFCQNHNISQFLRDKSGSVPGDYLSPETVLAAALAQRCQSISFTYTEPTVYFEYALEIAQLAHKAGLATCFVSNGFMTPEAIEMLAPHLDAINIDLKCFNPATYRNVMGGELDGVLDSIRLLREKGVWVEITTLLIEGMNDNENEVRQIAEFIAGLSADIPWHVSRFHPQYHRNDNPPTSRDAIIRALEAGKQAGLRHIYCGNVRDDRYESTWCHHCNAKLLERTGYAIAKNLLTKSGLCPRCQTPCAGVWAL